MKEYAQPCCTNCDKNSGSWCVCKTCRKNAKIVKKLRVGLSNMTLFKKSCKKQLGSEPYLNIESIIKELRALIK